SIGPTPKYEITVTKKTFDTMYLAITATGIVVFILVVALLYYMAVQADRWHYKPPGVTLGSQSHNNNTNFGSSATSRHHRNPGEPIPGSGIHSEGECPGTWTNGVCSCPEFFIGQYCTREMFDAQYWAIGEVEGIQATVLKTRKVEALSW